MRGPLDPDPLYDTGTEDERDELYEAWENELEAAIEAEYDRDDEGREYQ